MGGLYVSSLSSFSLFDFSLYYLVFNFNCVITFLSLPLHLFREVVVMQWYLKALMFTLALHKEVNSFVKSESV